MVISQSRGGSRLERLNEKACSTIVKTNRRKTRISFAKIALYIRHTMQTKEKGEIKMGKKKTENKKVNKKKTIRVNMVREEPCDLEVLFDQLDNNLQKLRTKLIFDKHVTTPLIAKSIDQLRELRLSAELDKHLEDDTLGEE